MRRGRVRGEPGRAEQDSRQPELFDQPVQEMM
jgi:hypothetical protein